MSITKEERAEWRKRLNVPYSDPCREASEMRDFSLRLLDALEAAEARAEAAERERDMLMQELVMLGCPHMYDAVFKGPHCNEDPATVLHDSQQCWLEWARQQARGGENE